MITQILFGTQYGHSRRYAEMIADALRDTDVSVQVTEAGRYSPGEETPGVIVFVGGNYAGQVFRIEKFIEAAHAYPEAKLVLLTVGMASASRTHEAEKLWHKNVPEDLRDRVQCFHARGGLDFSRLTAKHKIMMTAVRGFLTAKPHDKRHAEDQELLDTWGNDFDHVTREQIEPVLAALKESHRA